MIVLYLESFANNLFQLHFSISKKHVSTVKPSHEDEIFDTVMKYFFDILDPFHADILPRDFLQTPGNYYLWTTMANIIRSNINFTVKKFGHFFKAKAWNYQLSRTKELPRDFDESLQIVNCMAT